MLDEDMLQKMTSMQKLCYWQAAYIFPLLMSTRLTSYVVHRVHSATLVWWYVQTTSIVPYGYLINIICSDKTRSGTTHSITQLRSQRCRHYRCHGPRRSNTIHLAEAAE